MVVNKNLGYDIIRCLAIIFVICIHNMGMINAAIAEMNSSYGIKLIGGMNCVIHTGVPLFLMLSGALLLGKTEPIKLFFDKRLKRILVPFLIWSIVCFILKQLEDTRVNILEMPLQFIDEFFTSGTHGIYWYIYLIIGLYLITPILRVFFAHADKKTIYYFGGIMILITCVSKLFPAIQIFSRFSSLNLMYLTYFIMGYIVNKYLTEETLHGIPFKVLARIGLIVFLLGGFVEETFRIYPDFPWIFFTSIFLFSCLITTDFNKVSVPIVKIISFISSTSYGIYLSHFMLISLFVKLGIPSYVPLWIEPIFMTMIVLLVDMLMMWLIKLVKLNKYFM